MKAPPTDHETIKGYLLGQLPEEDTSEIEPRLLADREFYEELSIVEDELIDQYLGGRLSDSERRSFESHFISSSERQQKVRFAKALRKYVSVAGEETTSDSIIVFPVRKPLIPYAIAAAILVVIGVSYLFFRYWQNPSVSGRVLAVELSPAPLTRDVSEVNQLNLAPDIGSVRLQLDLPKNEYQSYEAVLRDSSVRTMLTSKDLKPQTINSFSAVFMDVKADLLSPGNYRIHLSGTTPDGRSESVATYSFTTRNQ